jgi:hypothetical protein
MLRNRPSVAILPDRQFLYLLEILEEVKDAGLLEPILRRRQQESRRDNPWFWSESWQAGERRADRDIRAGRVRRFRSPRSLLKDLKGS